MNARRFGGLCHAGCVSSAASLNVDSVGISLYGGQVDGMRLALRPSTRGRCVVNLLMFVARDASTVKLVTLTVVIECGDEDPILS